LRVLHLINDLDVGGAQSGLYYFLKYSRCLPNFTGEVCVIHELGEFGKKLLEDGIAIHQLGMTHRYSPLIAPRLHEIIETGNFQIVHVHLFPGLYWGAFISNFIPNCKWVYTEHSVWNRRRGLPWAKWLESRAYRKYDRIIAISQSVGDSLIAWQPWITSRLDIIPNGVDLALFEGSEEAVDRKRMEWGINEDTRFILFAGRLVKEKGLDILFQAMSSLRHLNWQLLIAGDGAERTNLETLSRELGIDDRVTFLGVRGDIPRLMAACDMVVLPSRWEGLPLTLLEVMAAGKPVVATQVGGVAEVLQDGVQGFLVPPENPMAMKEAISKLLGDEELAHSLGIAGKKRAAEFSASTISGQIISLYQQLI